MSATIFLRGQRDLRKVAVDSATVIAKGDMVWYDGSNDEVVPASDFLWTSNIATTQGNFAAAFMGIAAEASAAGETDPISIDMSPDSVYEIDVPSATYHHDTPLGPDEGSSSLLSQKLETAAAAAAIARSVQNKTGTRLEVKFASSQMLSNVNANVG